MRIPLLFIAIVFLTSCYKESEEDLFVQDFLIDQMDTTGTDTTNMNTLTSFSATIKPLIVRRCSDRNCHTAPNSPGGFAPLNTYSEIKLQANNGKLENRALVQQNMPEPGNPPLTAQEKIDLQNWLDEGALNN